MPTPKKTPAAPRSKLASRLTGAVAEAAGPVWAGPEGDGPNGGVTFSLLSRYLTCRERFRLLVVDGLKPAEKFEAPLEFGNMWHVCEEYADAGRVHHKGEWTDHWREELTAYCEGLYRKYPMQRDQVAEWYEKCRAMFPLYVGHWSRHDDMKDRKPLLSEQVFDVPYRLPSGRTVRLRGKWDSVDLVTKGKNAGVWLQENKSKSQVDQSKLARQLTFDLQTMLYIVALNESQATGGFAGTKGETEGVRGVRYNVVRRSAHKSIESMLKKIEDDRAAGRVGEWFTRFNTEIAPEHVRRFRNVCLDPLLENLCDWWHRTRDLNDWNGWILDKLQRGDYSPSLHWVHPLGVRNMLDEGGSTDLDDCVVTGSRAGLRRVDTLFPELQPGA